MCAFSVVYRSEYIVKEFSALPGSARASILHAGNCRH